MDIIGVLPVRIDFQAASRSITRNPGLPLLRFMGTSAFPIAVGSGASAAACLATPSRTTTAFAPALVLTELRSDELLRRPIAISVSAEKDAGEGRLVGRSRKPG